MTGAARQRYAKEMGRGAASVSSAGGCRRQVKDDCLGRPPLIAPVSASEPGTRRALFFRRRGGPSGQATGGGYPDRRGCRG